MLSALRPAAQRWARRELARAQSSTVQSKGGKLPRRADEFDSEEEQSDSSPHFITSDMYEETARTEGKAISTPDSNWLKSPRTMEKEDGHFRWCKMKGIALCSDRKTMVVKGRVVGTPEVFDGGNYRRTTVKLEITIDLSAFGMTGSKLATTFKQGEEVYAIGNMRSWLSGTEALEIGSMTAKEVIRGGGCAVPTDERTVMMTPASLIALGQRRLQQYQMFMGGRDVDYICKSYERQPRPTKVIDNLADCASHGLPMDWERLVCESCINQPNHLSMAELLDGLKLMEPNSKKRDIFSVLPQDKIMQQADQDEGQSQANTELVYTQIKVATEYMNALGDLADANIGTATSEPASDE